MVGYLADFKNKTMENYIYIIVALLPLASLMLVTQTNPYHALVIRAILGAIAALVYAVLGAADVALTEALVGTMLAITLYIIAVRSSLVMRLGILESPELAADELQGELIVKLKKIIAKYHLRLELVEYPDLQALNIALANQDLHGICAREPANFVTNEGLEPSELKETTGFNPEPSYFTKIRIHRLFEIIQQELTFPETSLTYAPQTTLKEPNQSLIGKPTATNH